MDQKYHGGSSGGSLGIPVCAYNFFFQIHVEEVPSFEIKL